jgi:hypothetical protein
LARDSLIIHFPALLQLQQHHWQTGFLPAQPQNACLLMTSNPRMHEFGNYETDKQIKSLPSKSSLPCFHDSEFVFEAMGA